MSSTALTKIKTELENTKERASAGLARLKQNKTRVMVFAAGSAGAVTGAIGSAVVDQKFGEDGETAKLGKTPIPINAAAGAAIAVVGIIVAKKHPVAGSFLFNGGLSSVNTSVYMMTRAKLEEMENS